MTVVTQTEFTDGKVTFRGPSRAMSLERLALDHVDTVRFIAANDYYVDVPTSDFQKYDVILATEADGKGAVAPRQRPDLADLSDPDHPGCRIPSISNG